MWLELVFGSRSRYAQLKATENGLLVPRAVVFVCGLEFFSTRAFLYISIIIVNIFVYAEGFSMIQPLDFLLPAWLRRLSTFIPEALSIET